MSFSQHLLICSSFQIEISRNARVFFVDALVELRSSLWSYVSKLAHLFDVLSSFDKLKIRKFKIELVIDDEIRNASSDSILLIDAFDYANDSNSDLLRESKNCWILDWCCFTLVAVDFIKLKIERSQWSSQCSLLRLYIIKRRTCALCKFTTASISSQYVQQICETQTR